MLKQADFLLCVINLALSSSIGKWAIEEAEDVGVLTSSNFRPFIKSNRHVFVKFYAPWCGHCKAMAPKYSALAKRMKREDGGIPIVQVDLTVEKSLSEEYKIKGYPTIMLFIDGVSVEYTGLREEDKMYEWIKAKIAGNAKEIETVEQLSELQKSPLAVLLVTSQDNAGVISELKNFAVAVDEIPVKYSFSSEIKNHLKLEGETSFVLLRNFDDGNKILSSKVLSLSAMKNFFQNYRYPQVVMFDEKQTDRIFTAERPAAFVLTDEAENETTQIFKRVAMKNANGPLIFAQSTITSGIGIRLAEVLGVTSADANTVRIVDFKGKALIKYKLESVTEESLSRFIEDWKKGKLALYTKSEPVPDDDDEEVKIVVGSTFEDMVLHSESYVLLNLYAPWDGPSKQFEPIYYNLAVKLAGVKDLVIAKMDFTANEHPTLNVTSFPTIKFYKRGSKAAPVDYKGERKVKALIAFLEKEMSRKLELENERVADESL